MNILFLHQNFPGQFRHLAAHGAARLGWKVVGLGDARNVKPRVSAEGVRVLAYRHTDPKPVGHPYLHGLDARVRRAQTVLTALKSMRSHGFTPDVIATHPSWGEAMFAREAFPKAKILAYCEFFYRSEGSDVGFDNEFPAPGEDDLCRLRLRNTAHLLALTECDRGWSPTAWQASQFPVEFQGKITVLHDGVDTDLVCPGAEATFSVDGRCFRPGDPVVTYVARNLEPYRGFHIFMRALPRILREHPTAHAVIVGGDEVSYGKPPAGGGTWRAALQKEVGAELEAARVHFTGKLPYADYLALLRISAAHVYLTYPFVLSWSMLESMAAGCVLIASDTAPVREVIEDGRNGLTVDFFDPAAIAARVGAVLCDPAGHAGLRTAARATAVERYDLKRVCLPGQLEMLRALGA